MAYLHDSRITYCRLDYHPAVGGQQQSKSLLPAYLRLTVVLLVGKGEGGIGLDGGLGGGKGTCELSR